MSAPLGVPHDESQPRNFDGLARADDRALDQQHRLPFTVSVVILTSSKSRLRRLTPRPVI